MSGQPPMRVTQIALGRFHHFHLARQLEQRGLLEAIWTGYPRAKLSDEAGIPSAKVKTFPWLYVPSAGLGRIPVIGRARRLARDLHWLAVEALDRRVAASIISPTIVVGLSSGGLHAGRRARALGGRSVCDRGSTHIRFQDAILREEYARWGLEFGGIDPRIVAKEEAEYEAADLITVPSHFCEQTFRDAGVPPAKIRVIPYGGRLDRFTPVAKPASQRFNVLFVGGVSIRKGVPYLLEAFAQFRHPAKTLRIVGTIQDDMRSHLAKAPLNNVELVGPVANRILVDEYHWADVLVLPSLEEGLALVMAEAMASGCPVIASENSGARNLFTDGREGFIIPVRSATAIVEALETLAGDGTLAAAMRLRAEERIKQLGGYDRYGDQWADLVSELRGDRVDKMRLSEQVATR